MPRFHRRRVVERLGAEVALAVGRAEPAGGKRLEGLRQAQADGMLAVELLERDAADERVRRIEQRADHVVFGIPEAGVVEAHALRQQAEHLYVRLRLAGGIERGPRQLQVVVAVGEVEVGMLQKRGGGQQDIGVIGGVVLELLQHDGEEVVAPQARAAPLF